jgi:hypothetical protein
VRGKGRRRREADAWIEEGALDEAVERELVYLRRVVGL